MENENHKIIDKDLVKYLSCKKVFYPVLAGNAKQIKPFVDGKKGQILMQPLFVDEESLLSWCKTNDVTPIGVVEYDIECEPVNYHAVSKFKKFVKDEKTPKKETTKRVKKQPSKQAVKKCSTKKEQKPKRIRRTKEEISQGLSLEEVEQKRKTQNQK